MVGPKGARVHVQNPMGLHVGSELALAQAGSILGSSRCKWKSRLVIGREGWVVNFSNNCWCISVNVKAHGALGVLRKSSTTIQVRATILLDARSGRTGGGTNVDFNSI